MVTGARVRMGQSTWRVIHIVKADDGSVAGFAAHRTTPGKVTVELPAALMDGIELHLGSAVGSAKHGESLQIGDGYSTVVGGYEFVNANIRKLASGPCRYWLSNPVGVERGLRVPLLVMARPGWRALLAPCEPAAVETKVAA